MRREGVDGQMAAITFLLSGSGGSVGDDNQALAASWFADLRGVVWRGC
jgi:hypothetical protein